MIRLAHLSLACLLAASSVLASAASAPTPKPAAPMPAKPMVDSLFLQPMPKLAPPVGLEMLFGPEDDIEGRIVREIANAKSEVLVNHYLITNPKVIDALAGAFRRKCVVFVVCEATPAVRDYEGIKNLRAVGIPVIAIQRPSGRWNNAKYLIIDRRRVLSGSCDLTRAAARNDEVLIVLEEISAVCAFTNNFISRLNPPSP